ncbi:uncharacterized protein MYCFIDRAFT_175913 [Pseudocercospora fijiensis CIRAD86]|uniref:Uncharacterized protein n=1 Tax=Pseudocercospora fijiensis (strain CIRAD86) TaxID=383855 RepID=M3ACU8_PSEFD|nr:uncharacterized protein MYCFIDRAFT_175913 [Pseudocercospora fijiensis CIRAD86]EME82376.1 hypothetical protein MYCFIDRAFT_175913 [Pseudocercospora fijiensis CIRAD86]
MIGRGGRHEDGSGMARGCQGSWVRTKVMVKGQACIAVFCHGWDVQNSCRPLNQKSKKALFKYSITAHRARQYTSDQDNLAAHVAESEGKSCRLSKQRLRPAYCSYLALSDVLDLTSKAAETYSQPSLEHVRHNPSVYAACDSNRLPEPSPEQQKPQQPPTSNHRDCSTMALADISLLPILITTILITKLLIANYHQPMREIDQNKTFSLLLFMHICAILGSISVAEDDTPIIGGWLGSLWSLRYVLAFFAAWLMECAWIIVGLRERERILFPALAFCLTEVCFWVWVLRIDQDYRVEVQVLGKRDVRDVLARLGWVFLAGSGTLAEREKGRSFGVWPANQKRVPGDLKARSYSYPRPKKLRPRRYALTYDIHVD